jgi:hypothetical protein
MAVELYAYRMKVLKFRRGTSMAARLFLPEPVVRCDDSPAH